MKRIKGISIKDFMKKNEVSKVKEIKKNKIYKITLITGLVLVIFLTGVDFTSAASMTGIDVGAQKIYSKLLLAGKWIIIIKGGIDTINNLLQGDHGAARKGFITYLVVYAILNALPWGLNQVDEVFKGM